MRTAIDCASKAAEPRLGITQKEAYTARHLSLHFSSLCVAKTLVRNCGRKKTRKGASEKRNVCQLIFDHV